MSAHGPHGAPWFEVAAHAVALLNASVAVASGFAVIVVGVLGWRGWLSKNRFAGIRTWASMRGEAAFRAANQAGGPLLTVGGAVSVAGGLVAFGLWAARAEVAAWICALAGIAVMMLLLICGGIVGNRAANR